MTHSWAIATATLLCTAACAPPAASHDESADHLGVLHFETSCNETAQGHFDRGMRYQHSFWYQASKEIFEDVLKADPGCVIAYWGIALSLLVVEELIKMFLRGRAAAPAKAPTQAATAV